MAEAVVTPPVAATPPPAAPAAAPAKAPDAAPVAAAPVATETPKPTRTPKDPQVIAHERQLLRQKTEAEAQARHIRTTAEVQARQIREQAQHEYAAAKAESAKQARLTELTKVGDYETIIKEFNLDPSRLSRAMLPAALRDAEPAKTPEQIADERATAIAEGKFKQWEDARKAEAAEAQRLAQQQQQERQRAAQQQQTAQEEAQAAQFVAMYDRKASEPAADGVAKYPFMAVEGGGTLALEVLNAYVEKYNVTPTEEKLLTMAEELAQHRYEERESRLPQSIRAKRAQPSDPPPPPATPPAKTPTTMHSGFAAPTTPPPQTTAQTESLLERAIRKAHEVKAVNDARRAMPTQPR